MASRCKKFQPNIFNKKKCQNCFGSKEQHSAEALESCKAARKISKCGYLFVAPETFDFASPLDRTRRWQRRFFVLYDDGELTYSVDENINTVPQGMIDMNKCTDVYDAENITGHESSIAIKTPDKQIFVKGCEKQEINRWYDVLVMYPRSTKTKHRRSPTYPTLTKPPDPPNTPSAQTNHSSSSDPAPVTHAATIGHSSSSAFSRYRSRKSQIGDNTVTNPTKPSRRERDKTRRYTSYTSSPSRWDLEEDGNKELSSSTKSELTGMDRQEEYTLNTRRTDGQEGYASYSRGEDVGMDSLVRARSTEGLSEVGGTPQREAAPITYRGVRSLKHKNDKSYQEGLRKSNSMNDLMSTDADDSPYQESLYRSRSRESLQDSYPRRRPDVAARSNSVPAKKSAPPEPVVPPRTRKKEEKASTSSAVYRSTSPTTTFLYNGRNKNETDEHKMAKSGELAARISQQLHSDSPPRTRTPEQQHFDDLMYMKKGWLLKQDASKDWQKHWFVLSGTSLKYYTDSRDEEANNPQGSIDIATCYDVLDLEVSRNYGFKVETTSGDYILSAMTSGIRNNWMQAVRKCMEMSGASVGGAGDAPSHTSSPARPASSRSQSADSKPSSSTPEQGKSSPIVNGQSQQNGAYTTPAKNTTAEVTPWRRSHSTGATSRQTPQTDPREESNGISQAALDSHFSSRKDSWGSRSEPRRRLTLDSSRDSIGSNHSDFLPPSSPQRKFSCTWPYVAPPPTTPTRSSGASSPASSVHSGSRSKSVDHGRPSDVCSYLSEEEPNKPKELSQEEEDELDNVQRNIRRIHRKSISEYVQSHKPQHFDKFEMGTVFTKKSDSKDKDQASRSASVPSEKSRHSLTAGATYSSLQDKDGDSLSSPRSESLSSPRRTRTESPRARRRLADDKPRSPNTPRAPSAKVKEKSRAKSPRAKSPPPVFHDSDDYIDGLIRTPKRRGSAPFAGDTPKDDIIERKWREQSSSIEDLLSVPDQVEKRGAHSVDGGGTAETSSLTSSEGPVVDLLETEVESLKAKLEHAQTEVEELRKTNVDLKAQMRTNRRDLRASLDDYEGDHSRYLSQIEDMQEEMEKATGYLKSRLAEQESRSELTKLQVQTLKSQLSEARDNMTWQEKEVNTLNTKLEMTVADLKTSQASLDMANADHKTEKAAAESTIHDLEIRVKALEAAVKVLKQEVKDKESAMRKQEGNLQILRTTLDERTEQVTAMEAELKDMHYLKVEVEEKAEEFAKVNDELALAKKQLEGHEEVCVKYKVEAEKRVLQLQTRLDQALKQSTMSDSLNSNMADILREKDETISQLEEKLIENDAKIEELTEELRLEIDENTTLQQNLDHAYDEGANLKRDLEAARKELEALDNQMETMKEDMLNVSQSGQEKDNEIENMSRELKREENMLVENEKEKQRLAELVEKYRAQAECRQEDAEEAQQSTKALQSRLGELSKQNHDLAKKCAAMARDLVAANNKATLLEQQLDEQKENFESDLHGKLSELMSAREVMQDLETKLKDTQTEAAENQKMLDSQLAELTEKPSHTQEEYEELQQKHEKLTHEVKRLRSELKDAQGNFDDLEISSAGLQQQLKAMENDYENQLGLMGTRVQDLTTKLANAEKRVRKLERKIAKKGKKRDKEGSDGENKETDESLLEMSLQEELQVSALPPGVIKDVSQQDLNISTSSSCSSGTEKGHSHDTPTSSALPEDDLSDNEQNLEYEDEAMVERIENQLLQSETKVKDMSEEEKSLHESHRQLREQNEFYKQQIEELQRQLQPSDSEEKDRNVASHMMEVESKLGHTQTVLEECRYKLQDVIQEIATYASMPSPEAAQNYASTIESIRAKLREILKDSTEHKSKTGRVVMSEQASKLDYNDKLKLFAEKLSLEAVVVGEMAYLVKTSQNQMMSEREDYLTEIQEANSRIIHLEQTVNSLQKQSSKQAQRLRGTQKDCMVMYSGMLAEKLVLQGKLTLLLDKYKEISDNSLNIGAQTSGDNTAKQLSHEALFRSKLDEKLYVKPDLGQSEGKNMNIQASALASQALAQGELAFILSKLKERMSGSMTDQERIDLMEQELELAQQRLHERQANMSEVVEAYQMDWLEQLATALAQEVALGSPNTSDNNDNITVNKENLETEMVTLVRKCAESYRQELSGQKPGSEQTEDRRHALIENAVKQEIDHTLQSLTEIYEEKLEEMTDKSDLGAGDLAMSMLISPATFQTDILPKFCEILSQKAVISGHIAYIMEQINQRPEKQLPPGGRAGDQIAEAPGDLRRHDSGVILHPNSLPTSPIEYENSEQLSSPHESDVRAMADRLASDANTRRELANYLQEYSNEGGAGGDEVKGQITKIAADLMNVDIGLVKQKKSINDYAEIITREAIFHAQMSYVVNKLKMKHETEISDLKKELKAAQNHAMPDKNVMELENEIEGLSMIINENDSLQKLEVEEAQEKIEELKKEIEQRDQDFQADMGILEEKYHNELEEIQHHLRETENELERLQEEKDDAIDRHKKRIEQLEEELHHVREVLEDVQDDREADIDEMEKKIEELEGDLSMAKNDLEKVTHEKAQEAERYEGRISSLEDELDNLKDVHERELEQVRSDMKLAMKAVSTQEMDRMDKEVRKLKDKLDDERHRHVSELEHLREELGVDTNTAAEAYLNSKVQQLEMQMQNMQADYEQELAVQKSGHRRELARSKDDLLSLLAAAEAKSLDLDKGTIRKKYMKEIDKIKDVYDRGFAAMERSHQKVLIEMRKTHKRELDTLRQEKDQLLAEETKATQAALDAMRKAHESELQKERNKFLDVIAKTYSQSDVESLQKQHEEDLELIQSEISKLSEQYSIKCLENAALEERLETQTRVLNECRRRITDLMTRNEELNLVVKHEIDRLNRLIKQQSPPEGASPMRKEGEPVDMYDLRVALKVKDVEVEHLHSEVGDLKDQLQNTTQELEDTLEKYQAVYNQNEAQRMSYQREVEELKIRLERMAKEGSMGGDRDDHRRSRALQARKDRLERQEGYGRSGSDESDDLSPDRGSLPESDSEAGSDINSHSASPNRSLSARSQSPDLGARSGTPTRQLPLVPTEARSVKKILWRQRQPQRSRSSPGLTSDTQLSLAKLTRNHSDILE